MEPTTTTTTTKCVRMSDPFALPSATPPATAGATDKQQQPKKRICCACPETKQARDDCLVQHGDEHPKCKALIEAHKVCLRAEGFNV